MKTKQNLPAIIFLTTLLVAASAHSAAAETSISPLAPPLPEHSGPETMTEEKLLQMPPYDLNVFPKIKWIDNRQFLYQFPTSSLEEKETIQLYNIDSRKSEFLVEGEDPVPSPDGQWIAFVRGEGKEKQLWRICLADKKLEQVSHVKEGLSGYYILNYEYVWSPDSKKIILRHQEFIDFFLLKNRNKSQPKVHLDFIDLATGESEHVATIDATVCDLSWISTTDEILFTEQRLERMYHDGGDQERIEALNIITKQCRTLIKIDGLEQFLMPISSHDGKQIVFKTDVKNPSYSYILNLCAIPSDADVVSHPVKIKSITNLDLKISDRPFSFCYFPDDQKMVAIGVPGPYSQLYKINLLTKKTEQLTFDALNIRSCDLSPDGEHLAWIGTNAHGQTIIRMASSNGSHVEDLITQKSISDAVALSEVREIEWSSEDYPVPIRGLLAMPLYYQAGEKYPLVIDIHGGDSGVSLSSLFMGGMFFNSPLEWQFWAARGYAVFVPEFRSSGCFGSLAIDRDLMKNHDRLGGDLNDIEAGVDFIIANGIVDPERLAIFGHSAGGLRANWFEIATHRYKAIVSHEGWADALEPALKESDKRLEMLFGGNPQDVPENYIKNSPLYFAQYATTPILFLMGNPDLGGADPYHAVFKFYEALKNDGVETEYHQYPDEGHVFKKLKNKKDELERTVSWIESHFEKP